MEKPFRGKDRMLNSAACFGSLEHAALAGTLRGLDVFDPITMQRTTATVAPVGADIAVKVIDEPRNELPVIRRLGRRKKDLTQMNTDGRR